MHVLLKAYPVVVRPATSTPGYISSRDRTHTWNTPPAEATTETARNLIFKTYAYYHAFSATLGSSLFRRSKLAEPDAGAAARRLPFHRGPGSESPDRQLLNWF